VFGYAIFAFGTRFFKKVRDLVRHLSLIISQVRDGRDFFYFHGQSKKKKLRWGGEIENSEKSCKSRPQKNVVKFLLGWIGGFWSNTEYIICSY